MKRKITVYLEDGLLRALKVVAARSGRHDHVVEQALRSYLGMESAPTRNLRQSSRPTPETTICLRLPAHNRPTF
jgi:hypothetical protein